MEKLCPGVLVKLLTGINQDGKLSKNKQPVLLQIRSIIPVLAEGQLWPNQGFFLKVSDSSHAIYASLPPEQDDMILSNKLQLGQLIYVKVLESANPAPLLRGVKPLPGRYPCVGNPQDLVSLDFMLKFREVLDSQLVVNKVDNHVRDNLQRSRIKRISNVHSNQSKDTRASNNFDTQSEFLNRGFENGESDFIDKEIDTVSMLSMVSSTSTSRRKSWNDTEIRRTRKLRESPVHKYAAKSSARSRSASCARSDSSDDNVSIKSKRKDDGPTSQTLKCSNKNMTTKSAKKVSKHLNTTTTSNPVDNDKHPEDKILWNTLPSNLETLGKDMIRYRDVALLAAAEALQEASAAERLLQCLSAYSELHSTEADDQQQSVDKFFNLQEDLDYTRLIFTSLRSVSASRLTDTSSNDSVSIRRAVKVALDRKKKAFSWINAALANDLKPAIPQTSKYTSIDATSSIRQSPSRNFGAKGKVPTDSSIVETQRIKDHHRVVSKPETEDISQDWVKGDALCAATDLDELLQNDCRRWFLAYIEQYLDQISSNGISKQSDSDIAGMMCQLKRVNEWLDAAFKKGAWRVGSKDCTSALKDYDLEAYGRVRNKIYGVLMNYIDRTAMAFEYRDATR